MSAEEQFVLVVFIDDPGEKLNIDFVPADWICYDTKRKHLVTPFVPNGSPKNLKMPSGLVESGTKPSAA